MKSVVSYPDRGVYGKSNYRGNCSGRLIEDLIEQFRLKSLSDFMVGSGTTKDVVVSKGLDGYFTDLSMGFDMLSMDMPVRSENIFWHPPYHDIIQYSSNMYDSKEVERKYGYNPEIDDLSRCSDWDDFVKKMNYCMMKQFSSLEAGGYMFTLMGDIKKKGRLYSMLCDIVKPGKTVNIVIKMQHRCTSESFTYSNYNFIPIVHEYVLISEKEKGLLIPISMTVKKTLDIRDSSSVTWRDVVHSVLQNEGKAMSLSEIYEEIAPYKKAGTNLHWKDKIRQTVQDSRYFRRTARGEYSVA